MNIVQRIAATVLMLAVAAAIGAGAWWLLMNKSTTTSSDKPTPAASVIKVVKEDDLNTVTLTEEAEKRLGLTIGVIEKKSVRQVRVYGGEVTVPVGRTILVAAPLGGTLEAPQGGMLEAGQAVRKGDVILRLMPLLSPEGRITMTATLATAEGQVKATESRLEANRTLLTRAKNAFTQSTGSKAAVEVAQGNYDEAMENHEGAKHNRDVLLSAVGELEKGKASPIPIVTPRAGILRVISALPDQQVPSGAALFEIMDLSTAWVRVPLPVNDLDTIDRTQPAHVGRLSAPPGTKLVSANVVAAPPSANPLAATVDFFYALPNSDGKLIPGQRLGVTIPLTGAAESSTISWSAVVFDIHGGTWVYEQLAPHKYARRRVVVAYTIGSDAVLASGPAVGLKVVTAGTMELFGAETGFVK